MVEVQHIRTHERKDTSKIDEFLSTQWIEPFADMVVDDFLDDVIFDSDSHIQDDLKLKYTFSEIFVANTIFGGIDTIGEMLNSNNYIDSSGTVLGSSPMSTADLRNFSIRRIHILSLILVFRQMMSLKRFNTICSSIKSKINRKIDPICQLKCMIVFVSAMPNNSKKVFMNLPNTKLACS